MSALLIEATSFGERSTIARGPLAPLASSLAADLHVAAARELFVPTEKARLTRAGGRCSADGTVLAFDPYAPRRHRCPTCGRVHDDDAHYRWWIMWYQLWLAERAVYGAALGVVTGDEVARAFALRVLDALAERYLAYPNADNVLGPTRPFFSTYLESIWLLQLCVALDLLELDRTRPLGGLSQRFRERVVEPSRALIALYDEHRSNRQVWNAAALAAAARLLGDDAGVERAILGRAGVAARLADGLLPDGTWYEGENYHQFAHRGLWYGVTIGERAGLALPPALVARFEAGFVAPFLTALPDLTLPARRDSQWASSLRQWRWAEWCELGVARTGDERLAATLATLYADDDTPRRDTGRWRSAAESERNEPPTRLTRADLGWKSLLFARAELPNASWTPPSVLLDAQGIAVFRRAGGERWSALDYGASGGSHGHPDRLNVLLADGPRRWLDDMGTGSYVDRSLHWYRSTLAHNAPLVDGRSQQRVDGTLEAYDEDGAWGWALASAVIAPGVGVQRALVVGPTYAVDRLEWRAERAVTLDLPLHVDATTDDDLEWGPVKLEGGGNLEDGFNFLANTSATSVPARRLISLRADASRAVLPRVRPTANGPVCRSWLSASTDALLIKATAPGAPGQGDREFRLVRVAGTSGTITTVWDTRDTLAAVDIGDDMIVRRRDGSVDVHRAADRAWRVAERTGDRETRRTLGGARTPQATSPQTLRVGPRSRYALPADFVLGEAHYRRTEQSWREAGEPAARVSLRRRARSLDVVVDVTHPSPTFVPAGAENPLDNERAEVNGDGVQLYIHPLNGELLGWLLMPDDDAVRVIPLGPAAAAYAITATWRRTANGYVVSAELPLTIAGAEVGEMGFDLIVNETVPGRERRRGQLVLSGARGEFAYLQGDRHDAARLIVLDLATARPDR